MLTFAFNFTDFCKHRCLDFQIKILRSTGPSEVELLTETQMIPLLIHNEQVERLEKDNRRLSHRLQAAKVSLKAGNSRVWWANKSIQPQTKLIKQYLRMLNS